MLIPETEFLDKTVRLSPNPEFETILYDYPKNPKNTPSLIWRTVQHFRQHTSWNEFLSRVSPNPGGCDSTHNENGGVYADIKYRSGFAPSPLSRKKKFEIRPRAGVCVIMRVVNTAAV